MKFRTSFLGFAMVIVAHTTSAMSRPVVKAVEKLSNSSAVIEEIRHLFAQKGNAGYMIGEALTQQEHAFQAAHIARAAGADSYSVVGALLHDMGNFVSPSAGEAEKLKTTHAQLGGDWLKEHGFPQEVYQCAYLHTFAKVWLCGADPNYLKSLSLASQESYVAQKEQFKDEQKIESSLRGVNFVNLIALRRCDDMAKMPGIKPNDFSVWWILIHNTLDSKGSPPRHYDWQNRVQMLQEMLIKDPEEFIRHVYGDEQKRIEEQLWK